MIRTYVVTHDYGFAPNPFGGVLTLACCKPQIRRMARVGDWIVGTLPRGIDWQRLCFAAKVSEAMTFDEYSHDDRFGEKRPTMQNSGDAIYQLGPEGRLERIKNRFHGPDAVAHDISVDRVLICRQFWYFGDRNVHLPPHLADLLVKRGPSHRNCSDPNAAASLGQFLEGYPTGLLGQPRMALR